MISRELRSLAALALPSAIAQLGMMLMGTVDTMMVGHLGVEPLAAAALANALVWGSMSLLTGVVMGASPLIAHARGAGQPWLARRLLAQAVVVALAVTPLAAAMWWNAAQALQWFGQDAGLAQAAAHYLKVQINSIPAWFGFAIARDYLMSRGVVWRVVAIVFFTNVLNAGANWVLIYGHFGFAPLGLVGAGIATAISRWAMCGWMFYEIAKIWRREPPSHLEPTSQMAPWSGKWLRDGGIGKIVRLGIPIGFNLALEAWAFQIATLAVGILSARSLGAHTVVLNLCSLTFMFPLGISAAAATRVGLLLGAGEFQAAQRAAGVALGLGGGIMASFGMIFWIFRAHLPRLYGSDVEVLALASALLPIAGVFQLFDGLQGVGAGIFRGMGQPRPAVIFNFVGYYLIGLPLGWLAARQWGLGVQGIWWGLCTGLCAVAILMCLYLWRRGPARGGSF